MLHGGEKSTSPCASWIRIRRSSWSHQTTSTYFAPRRYAARVDRVDELALAEVGAELDDLALLDVGAEPDDELGVPLERLLVDEATRLLRGCGHATP